MWAPASGGFGAAAGPDAGGGLESFGHLAERFTTAASAYFAAAATASPTEAAAAAGRFGDFLREQFAPYRQPWNSGPWPGASPQRSPAVAAFGATREHQQRGQRATDAAQRLNEAQLRLQRLWFDSLREAAAAFAARLGPLTPTGFSATALRRVYDLWIDCAEDAYGRTAHSETFCNALADLVNAGSQLRSELQAGTEQWAKVLDLPTRSEINSLARRLRAVEEGLHAAAESRPAAPRASPPPAASRASPPSAASRAAEPPKPAAAKAPRAAGKGRGARRGKP
jgi:hypothetical protein